MNDKLKGLSQEEKEELVDKVNEELETGEDEDEGNTSIFTMNDISEEAGQGSAQAQYEKSITANAQSIYALDQLLNSKGSVKISRKNLVKLLIATLKLPEEGATLKFGGTRDQVQMCEFAFAQAQLAANTRAFVLGVSAMRQQRRAMKEQEEQQKQESESKSEDKENNNE